MITKQQQYWLNHLSDRPGAVTILPYDPETPKRFQELERRLRMGLDDRFRVVHRGASSLGISGQGELDIYIPVPPEEFNKTVEKVKQLLGEPGSRYPLERARFVTHVASTRAEVFVINEESQGWLDGLKFENHLKKNQKLLERYRILKEEGHGLSTREYYRRKIEFINEVLAVDGNL